MPYRFKPEPDITAYEIAELLPLLVDRGTMTIEQVQQQIDALPPSLRRHIIEEAP